MKDPKVTELVKQFDKDVKALNKTWSALQRNRVYVRLNVLGQSTFEAHKYIEVDQITQHVEYTKEEK